MTGLSSFLAVTPEMLTQTDQRAVFSYLDSHALNLIPTPVMVPIRIPCRRDPHFDPAASDKPGVSAGVLLALIIASVIASSIVCPASSASAAERFVLLRTDRVLSGHVENRDRSIIVRQGQEAEIVLSAREVVAVADSMEELYRARASTRRRILPSVETLIDDLRWCVDNRLPSQATLLLFQIHRLSPDHPRALQLERRLRDQAQQVAQAGQLDQAGQVTQGTIHDPSRPADVATPPDAAVTPTNFTLPSAIEPWIAPTPVDVPAEHQTLVHPSSAPESLHRFTARVQPILVSRCGQCHHENSQPPTRWNLVLPPMGNRVTQRGSVMNLQATLRYCDSGSPELSELVVNATSSHHRSELPSDAGSRSIGSQSDAPPIAAHETHLVETLIAWIRTLPERDEVDDEKETEVERDGASSTPKTSSLKTAGLKVAQPKQVAAELNTLPPMDPSESELEPESESEPEPIGPATSGRPKRLPTIESPSDVRHFNRQTELLRWWKESFGERR